MRIQKIYWKYTDNIVNKILELGDINSILIYGSLGKGYSDRYSDIDIVAVSSLCNKKIQEKIKELKSKLYPYELDFKEQDLSINQFDSYPSLNDSKINYNSYRTHFVITNENLRIDVTVRFISERVFDTLLKKAKIDFYSYQTLCQYFIDSKIIYDKDERMKKIIDKVGHFKKFSPDLYKKIVKDCDYKLKYYLEGEIPDGIIRKDFILEKYEFNKAIQLFLIRLYAINDKCLAYPKWMHKDLLKLKDKPKNLDKRLKKVIDKTDISELKKLVIESKAIL